MVPNIVEFGFLIFMAVSWLYLLITRSISYALVIALALILFCLNVPPEWYNTLVSHSPSAYYGTLMGFEVLEIMILLGILFIGKRFKQGKKVLSPCLHCKISKRKT
ncbi:hypothetical protein [Desulforamulus ruminis]|uniref:hypothetical protein n=1 Tax=Desulforamulus ruminis TaxID=1564 RepID=UPI002FDAF446